MPAAPEPPLRKGLALYTHKPGLYLLVDVRDRDRQVPLGKVGRGSNGAHKRWYTEDMAGTVRGPYRKRMQAITALAGEAGFR